MSPERFSFAETAEKFGDYPALICPDYRITYREYFRLIAKTAERLREANVAAGEQVAILGQNCLEYPILLMALWQTGAIAVPLNPRFPEKQITGLLQKTGCQKLIRLPKPSQPSTPNPKLQTPNSKLQTEDPQIKYRISNIEYRISGYIFSKTSNHPITQSLNHQMPATLILTSGSSGEPKAALHTFGNHYYSALGSNLNIPFGPGDCWLLSLPLYHVGGLAILFRALAGGGTVAVADENMPLPEAIEKLKVTHLSLVATQLFRLLKKDGSGKSLASLKAILLGGSAIPPALIQAALERGLPIHTSYGSTEMSSQITTTPTAAPEEKLLTSGRTLKYREIKIAPDGEILVRGKTLFRGYWEKNSLKKPFDVHGWFATGDTGKFDEDGYLMVLGRKDNMFISGGENIQPEEIEAALCQMAEIEEAVVVPVENEEFGMRPAAFLKIAPGKKVDQSTIRSFLTERLPRFKMPNSFLPWPEETVEAGIKIDRKYFQKIAQEKKD